ncbi:UNVERIFIED_CONTAM: hypothetical protein Sradi_0052100 [Sesamum radiatum]|uniref:Uncharacterized protein n=1 Tax=Sesamum radiatum TaxID=300843 RepID=A0AAW2WH33_SESRA
MESTTLITRSLLCNGGILEALSFYKSFRFLRVLDLVTTDIMEIPFDFLFLVNLRYLAFSYLNFPVLPYKISLFWKLQTLIAQDLRIIIFRDSVEEVLRKFPNLKKLSVSYYADSIEDWSAYNLKNLVRLSKLENLKCAFTWPPNETFLPNLNFPQSLKKLTLIGSKLSWKDMSIIGSLPHLEVLKLRRFASTGEVWEPVEGEFCRLKFLLIEETNLVQWIAENTHFPCLEHLIIRQCRDLIYWRYSDTKNDRHLRLQLFSCRVSRADSGGATRHGE